MLICISNYFDEALDHWSSSKLKFMRNAIKKSILFHFQPIENNMFVSPYLLFINWMRPTKFDKKYCTKKKKEKKKKHRKATFIYFHSLLIMHLNSFVKLWKQIINAIHIDFPQGTCSYAYKNSTPVSSRQTFKYKLTTFWHISEGTF